MTSLAAVLRLFLLLTLGLWIAGCTRIPDSEADDRTNPDFLKGTRRLNEMDYKGAVEAFERALLRNPRSAASHWELGLLYEQKLNDYASAIYHYQKHLGLLPNSNVKEMVRERIASCRLELARSVSFSLVNQQVQAGLDRLTSENASLRHQVEQLKAQLAGASNVIAPAPVFPTAPATNEIQPAKPAVALPADRLEGTNKPAAGLTNVVSPARAVVRTHLVRPGETPFRIAQKYGLTVEQLLRANPGLVPQKMRAGQSINIPQN